MGRKHSNLNMEEREMNLFKAVKQPLNMYEAIARQIEDQIFLGQLKPHDMLPSETDLMKQFGVGRNTVREALRMVEASGLIKMKQGPRGGAVITPLTSEFVSDFLIKAMRLREVSVAFLSQFRLALEPSMVEMLAGQQEVDSTLIKQMESNILNTKALLKTNKVTGYHNMDFHVLLAEATGNPLFIVILRTLRACFNLIAPPKKKVQLETIRYHENILDAIKNHDQNTAREQMYQHLTQIAHL